MKVRFGDVVKEVKVNIDRAQNPYEFYVAGDHMDSEDFKIRRRGRFATDDVGPAFTRYFKPGQILYGSRRTYLKKVCVADFEGICANTTFVFESKDASKLDQRILPFLMLSDGFTKWSIQHSKGSTNPYVLFSDLADYEFDLPPIEKQRELAELLWAANDLKESYKKLIAATDEMLKAKFRSVTDPLVASGAVQKLDDFVEDDRPICYGILMPGEEIVGGVPVIKVRDFPNGEILLDKLIHTSREIDENYRRSRLRAGDLLISIRGSVGRIAEVPLALENANITQDTARLTIKAEFDRNYVRGVLESAPIQRELEKNTKGVAIRGINIGFLRELMLPVASARTQKELGEIARKADETKATLKKSIADVEAVMKGLING